MAMSEAQAEFLYLRHAVLHYLKSTQKAEPTKERRQLLDAFASNEWKRVDESRRLWAFGACGKNVSFPLAKDLSTRKWRDLPDDLRDALAPTVLEWSQK